MSVLIYRKQPWLDWLKVTMDFDRTFDNLTPKSYTINTDKEDVRKALKPYWKSIFIEEMISPKNWPKFTEKTFYEWFEVKKTINCFIGPEVR
jgi:hypothetical protein